ncbi:amino acid ABC transporter permease [Ensifer adhaerens]|jgi:polar amino acid transport system permease protein|uniref:Amino acid ABC transporter permease n=1 Tax=Ensifer adhaerens TaxID=106592 RepID=A0A9Q8YDU4_ENSAD|nr:MULTISPECIES: amino acid ABC transporter permease [Ensifer]KSV80524.1 amino acid ABC transporter permease [Sinorhizobium sp. GL2]KQZ40849.1 amino acid ABC transporter permease [Ensifer sp. Root558]MBD9494207.1 amino acid ABC transporter permease [Ensifer sp. ENS01]MBD9523176.1 amino acid ABC transporter permease [Ensifer sp. ENS02]MBD9557884.1 amino acid ABC transporter permease [Ensifer sp. ENS03]
MSFLRSVRPSNLIILTALPFIIYLFISSGDYQRSLRAILGVENGSSAFVPGFLALAIAFTSGIAVLVFSRAKAPRPRLANVAALLNLAAAAVLVIGHSIHPFIASVVANGVDPFKSTLIAKGVTPRQLTEAADLMVQGVEAWLFPAYLGVTLIGLGLHFWSRRPDAPPDGRSRRIARWIIGLVNGAGLVFIFFFAHIAFAAGVATTIRAAIAAYILAALMGLVWVGLLQLHSTVRTSLYFAIATLVLAVAAGWFLMQPRDTYVLAGTLDGKVGIITNTPAGLISAVRFGQYDGAPQTETPVRTFVGPTEALASIAKGEGVSGALLPAASAPADMPVLWKTEALNDRDRAAGVTVAVLAIILGLLTFGGYLHQRHPLAIGSEFIVDTIRGIPMLVIVLYVGLPLSGALKDATQGVLDPPNLMRGIVAMALAYSAYLAEIFRSGINAIPVGQVEAARSIGLNRWQTARLVVLPQAFRIIIPPLGNELIAILKDTSLLSILSIRDITQRMREFQSASFLPFAPYNSAAIFYIFLTLAAASLVNMIERKYDIKHR